MTLHHHVASDLETFALHRICVIFFSSHSYSYCDHWLPFVAPYLLPATNTLMTCSVYATVAVAINRFTEMTPNVNLVRVLSISAHILHTLSTHASKWESEAEEERWAYLDEPEGWGRQTCPYIRLIQRCDKRPFVCCRLEARGLGDSDKRVCQ